MLKAVEEACQAQAERYFWPVDCTGRARGNPLRYVSVGLYRFGRDAEVP